MLVLIIKQEVENMKHASKKGISIVLAVMMLTASVPLAGFAGIDLSALTVNASDIPEYITFQAEVYSSEEVGFDNIFIGTDSSSFARTYYNNMKNDNNFTNLVKAWDYIHIATSPSYSLKSGQINKKDFYETVLFDMLDVSNDGSLASQFGSTYDKLFKLIKNNHNSFVVSTADKIMGKDSISADELNTFKYSDLSAEAKKLLLNGTKYAQVSSVISDVNKLLGYAKSAYEAIETVADYLSIKEYQEGTKEILDYIVADTRNDPQLRLAAGTVAECFDKSFNSVLLAITQGTLSGFETCLGEIMDEAWDQIVAAIPGGSAVLLAGKGARALCNYLFSTDKEVEGYYLLQASVNIEDAIIRALTTAQEDMKTDNVETATVYMQGISMYKNVVLLGFDYSIDLLETAANSNFNTSTDFWLGNYSECMSLISDVESFKTQKINNYVAYENIVFNSYKQRYYPDYDEVEASLNKITSSTAQYTLYWPVPTTAASIGKISSAFGPRKSPTAGASTNHRGIDIPVGTGTPVYAAYDGVVVAIGKTDARGNYVLLYHASIGLSTLYQHLTNATVQKGATVNGGSQIALSGNTGIGTGAHLHYGVMVGKATKVDNDLLSYDMAINPLDSRISYVSASGNNSDSGNNIISDNPDDYTYPTRDLFYTSPVKTGDDVKWVQAVLWKLGYDISIDGSYGPATRDAIKEFQTDYRLTVDGSCGPNTRSKLLEQWNRIKNGDITNISLHVWLSAEEYGNVPDEFIAQDRVYLCYELVDSNTWQKINDLTNKNYTSKMTLYGPDGSVQHTATYKNFDNSWISIVPKQAGVYRGVVEITGDINKTGTVSFNLEYAPTIELSKTSINLNLNGTNTAIVNVTVGGGYPGEYIIRWEEKNSVISASWGSWDGNTIPLTITGLKPGSSQLSILILEDYTGNRIPVKTVTIPVSVTANTYTISYNANGGSNAPTSQTKIHNQDLILSSSKPTGKTYTVTFYGNGGTVSTSSKIFTQSFAGWNTNSSGTGTTYQAGGIYSANAATTLYAKWENPKLSVSNPTRSGYYFLGWYDNTTTDSYGLPLGNRFTSDTKLTSSITLYAMWSLSPTVMYGDYDLDGQIKPIDITAFNSFKLGKVSNDDESVNNETRFRGDVDADGDLDDNDITIINQVRSGSLNYTDFPAYKKLDGFYVLDYPRTTYEYGEAFDASGLSAYIYYTTGTYYFFENNLVVSGYDPYKIGTQTLTVNYYQYSDTFTVTVKAPKYSLYYNANGGSVSPSGKTVTYGESIGSLPTPVRDGYTFLGWSYNQSSSVYVTASTAFSYMENKTLYAQWQKNTYTLSYSANGGTTAPATQTGTTTYTISTTVPARFGYTFLGWSKNSSATYAVYVPGDSISLTENTTLYAVWKQQTLTSSSIINTSVGIGGQIYYCKFTPSVSGTYVIYSTGSKDTKVYLYNASGTQLSSNDDGEDGQNFRLQYDLTAGTTYYYGVSYYSSTETGSIPIVFGKVYTISYNANGGSGAPSAQKKDYDKTATLSSTIPTRSGYVFEGWATSSTATIATYQPGDIYSTEADTTLYAVWHSHSYTSSVTKAATCTATGIRTYTCSGCYDSYTESIAATGHKWTAATCTAPKTCSTCKATEGSAHGHSYTSKVTKAATCTAAGVKTFTCSKCSDSYTESIAATGHNWTAATCTSAKTCSTCNTTDGSALGHSYTSAVTKAATCTAAGVKTFTCSVCDDSYTEAIPAKGHTAGAAVMENKIEATCTIDGSYNMVVYCATCNDKLSSTAYTIAAKGHAPGADATCTTDQTCTVCGKVLTDKLGHNYKAVVTAPTCTDDGFTTYTCANCGDNYVADEIPATGHSYSGSVTTEPTHLTDGVRTYTCACGDSYTESITKTPEHNYNKKVTAPTCTRGGYTVYYCSCGDNYVADEISATGHSYEAAVTTAPTCTTKGVKTYTCANCGDTYTEELAELRHTPGATVMEDKIEATCTADGSYNMVVYCAVCNEKLSTTAYTITAKGHMPGADATCTEDQNCTVCSKVLTDKLGHNYKAVVTAPTCTDDGFTTYTCANCGDNYVADEVSATGHSYSGVVTTEPTHLTDGVRTYTCACGDSYTESITKTPEHNYNKKVTAPTCTRDGYTVYYCSCGDTYAADEIPATGHNHEATVTTAPTCTTKGVKTYTCANCGDTYTEELAKLGHTPGATVMEDKIEATCTADGSYNMVVYCAVCHEKLSTTAYTITAKGHTPGAEATCTTDQTCTVCGEVLTAKTGHSYTAIVTAPTCEADGYTTYTCSVCGDTYTADEVAAVGHNYTAAVTTSPTCTAKGVKTYTCANCGDTYTEAVAELGHTPGATVTEDKIEATCTEDGAYNMVVYCAVCNEKLSTTAYTIAAKGHTPGASATCTEDQTCTACGEVLTAKTGHSYTAVVTAPTCTAEGYTTYTCANCGDSYVVDETAAVGHNYEAAVTTAPTCTAKGVKTYTCASCGDTYTEDLAKLAHTPGADATCTEDQVCTVCGEILTAKLGHDYDSVVTAPTCTAEGFTTYTCANCGDTYVADEVAATGHSWDEGIVSTEPTTETDGVMTYTCTVCGVTRTEVIDKLQDSFTESEDAFLTEDEDLCIGFGKTADELLTQAGAGATLVNKKGETLSAGDKVGTGAVLTLADGTQYEIILPGDCDGDAAITSGDARFALRYSVGLENAMEGTVYAAAAAVDTTAGVAAGDARAILRASVGLDDPAPWYENLK